MSHLVGSIQPGMLADIVLWKPALFGAKPELVLKGGTVAYSQMGDPNASIPTPQPVVMRPMFGAFGKASLPIPVGAFNRDGTIFAYAVSYDWSKGSEHYNPRTNHLLLHPVPEPEIKSRNTARKGFGTRTSR